MLLAIHWKDLVMSISLQYFRRGFRLFHYAVARVVFTRLKRKGEHPIFVAPGSDGMIRYVSLSLEKTDK